MSCGVDYYEVLQVTPDAEHEVIRVAYRTLARKYHPDQHGGDPRAQERMRLLNEAYEVLGDPSLRQEYDLGRNPRQAAPLDEWEHDEISSLVTAAAWVWQVAVLLGRQRWALLALLLTTALFWWSGRVPSARVPELASTLQKALSRPASARAAVAPPSAPAPAEAAGRIQPAQPPPGPPEAGDGVEPQTERRRKLLAAASRPQPLTERASPGVSARAAAWVPEPGIDARRSAASVAAASAKPDRISPQPTPVPEKIVEEDGKRLAAEVENRYGVVLDATGFTPEEIREQMARMELAKQIRSRHGVTLDWQGYSLEELEEQERRLALAQQLVSRYGVVLDGRSFGLEELREIEARARLAAEIGRDFHRTLDWQGYTLEELEQEKKRLQQETNPSDGVTLDPAPRPDPGS